MCGPITACTRAGSAPAADIAVSSSLTTPAAIPARPACAAPTSWGGGVTLTLFPVRRRGPARLPIPPPLDRAGPSPHSLEEVWHVELVVFLEDHGTAPGAGRVRYPPAASAGRGQRRFLAIGPGRRRSLRRARRRHAVHDLRASVRGCRARRDRVGCPGIRRRGRRPGVGGPPRPVARR